MFSFIPEPLEGLYLALEFAWKAGGALKRLIGLFISLVLTSGCSSLPKATLPSEQVPSTSYQVAYIVNHGWHTGIVYPREELLHFLPELAERFGDGQYLEIGWGDMEFYQSREVTVGITLRAIFLPTDSVLHVASVPSSPYESFPNSKIRKMCLGQAQIKSLGRFISNSFERDPSGRAVATQKGLYGDSQFYSGVGSFNVFNTCNKWTAIGLESAGFDIDASFNLTASDIIEFLDSDENTNKAMECPQQENY
ncbi:TIGR02117 family protein [Photobacterium sp. SDRW27]|uniref:TIGR02117 family protein n=1 Tax=Photobacterium obscurum TaxID=2829490 RepID=UPI002244A4C6|nr:TIGR02117 family protein [Photobacterium obscurum]MCW8330937.1 TIGR02117 family protein [Photobacterium obscurum]